VVAGDRLLQPGHCRQIPVAIARFQARVDGKGNVAGAQGAHDRQAGSVLEEHVEKGNVGRMGVEPSERGGIAGERTGNPEAGIFKRSLESHRDEQFILDQQARRRRCGEKHR
jgi:hypothetical protein